LHSFGSDVVADRAMISLGGDADFIRFFAGMCQLSFEILRMAGARAAAKRK